MTVPTSEAATDAGVPRHDARREETGRHRGRATAGAKGLIERQRGSIVIIDRKQLEKLSNGTYAPAVYN